jgi:hypothetical protein
MKVDPSFELLATALFARRQKRTTALSETRVQLTVPPELCRPT